MLKSFGKAVKVQLGYGETDTLRLTCGRICAVEFEIDRVIVPICPHCEL